ncbi:class A beta-lactamase-related serine hydrolase [Lactobacillus sp. 23-2]|uniref:serine hydrolase n=1 Tax=Lactobacillus sp. 23-2 TaxID=2981842 RepID=UPI0038381B45
MLASKLDQLLRPLPGREALLITNAAGEVLFQTDSVNDRFKSASLIKLGVAAYMQAHPMDLTQTVTVKDEAIVEGGMLCHLAQRNWSLRDLLDLMLSDSDNTATNVLIDWCGFDQLAAWFKECYQGLHLGRYLMAEADSQTGKENYITAAAAMKLFKQLLDDPSPFGEICRGAMYNQSSRNKLIENLPEGCSWNKTGELDDTEHDIARIMVDDQYLDVCFMSHYQGLRERAKIILAMNQVGELAYQELGGTIS